MDSNNVLPIVQIYCGKKGCRSQTNHNRVVENQEHAAMDMGMLHVEAYLAIDDKPI